MNNWQKQEENISSEESNENNGSDKEKYRSSEKCTLHRKWSFTLWISSVNVTKSAVSYR